MWITKRLSSAQLSGSGSSAQQVLSGRLAPLAPQRQLSSVQVTIGAIVSLAPTQQDLSGSLAGAQQDPNSAGTQQDPNSLGGNLVEAQWDLSKSSGLQQALISRTLAGAQKDLNGSQAGPGVQHHWQLGGASAIAQRDISNMGSA
jgi:hypothetical protein